MVTFWSNDDLLTIRKSQSFDIVFLNVAERAWETEALGALEVPKGNAHNQTTRQIQDKSGGKNIRIQYYNTNVAQMECLEVTIERGNTIISNRK